MMKTPSESNNSNQSFDRETNVIPLKSETSALSDGDVDHTDVAPKARVADATKRFHDFLLGGEGENFGLTYEKFASRSSNIEETDGIPGTFVVSVERHRAVAGATYHKGSPMSAYETYTQQILFDPTAGTGTDLADVHRGYDININLLASESFDCDWRPVVYQNAGWKGRRRVEVPAIQFKFETDSYDDARCKIEERFRELNHESQFEGLEMSEEEKFNNVHKSENAIVELALDALERSWAEPELADD